MKNYHHSHGGIYQYIWNTNVSKYNQSRNRGKLIFTNQLQARLTGMREGGIISLSIIGVK